MKLIVHITFAQKHVVLDFEESTTAEEMSALIEEKLEIPCAHQHWINDMGARLMDHRSTETLVALGIKDGGTIRLVLPPRGDG